LAGSFGFAFKEIGDVLGVVSEMRKQDFERDTTAHTDLLRRINRAHAADTDQGFDLIFVRDDPPG
jgi:hypothetical protein